MTTLAIFNLGQNLNEDLNFIINHFSECKLTVFAYTAIVMILLVPIGILLAYIFDTDGLSDVLFHGSWILMCVAIVILGVAGYKNNLVKVSASELTQPIKKVTILLNNPEITTDASHKDLDETVNVYYNGNGSRTKLAKITKINTNSDTDSQIEVDPTSDLGKCYIKVADYVANKDLSEQPQLEIGKDYVKANIVYANGKKENVTSRVSDNNQSDSDKDAKKVNL